MGQENCGVTAAVSIFAFNSKWRYERKKNQHDYLKVISLSSVRS